MFGVELLHLRVQSIDCSCTFGGKATGLTFYYRNHIRRFMFISVHVYVDFFDAKVQGIQSHQYGPTCRTTISFPYSAVPEIKKKLFSH